MEYYLYRNGHAVAAYVHNTQADAKAQLEHYKEAHPDARWYMEDEDSVEVTV